LQKEERSLERYIPKSPFSDNGVPLSAVNIKTNDDAESIFSGPPVTDLKSTPSPLRVKQ